MDGKVSPVRPRLLHRSTVTISIVVVLVLIGVCLLR